MAHGVMKLLSFLSKGNPTKEFENTSWPDWYKVVQVFAISSSCLQNVIYTFQAQ